MKFYKTILVLIFLLAGFLRFYDISNNPPGLYIDEVSIGNDAYSILKTGKDESGQTFPLYFRSFGDYKMPVYIYSVASSMSVFGKNEFAIRFPSALAGTLTVIIIYFLLKNLLSLDGSGVLDKKFKYLPILTSLLLAISPWHLQFSRAGFEVNQAVFIFLLACLLVSYYLHKRNVWYLLGGFLLFVLTIYTYHIFRILSPITLVILSIWLFRTMPKERIKLVWAAILSLLLIFPMLKFSLTQSGMERFSQTSAFAEYPAKTLLKKVETYPIVFLKNYFSFFSLNYLFSNGDGNGRHQIPDTGLLYLWQLPFILLGLCALVKEKRSFLKYFIFGLLILSPIPGSIARPSPHTLRNLLSVIPFITLTSIGIILFLSKTQKYRKLLLVVIFFIVTYCFLSYLHLYYVHYPIVNDLDWDGESKQAVIEAFKYEKNNYKIIVDDGLVNFIYYFNFYNTENLQKPVFVEEDWIKPKEWNGIRVLYVRPYYGIREKFGIIKNIMFSNQNRDIAFQFWEY